MHRLLVARALLAITCCGPSAVAAPRPPQEPPEPPPIRTTAPTPTQPQAPPDAGPLDVPTQQALERLATMLSSLRAELDAAVARGDQAAVTRLKADVSRRSWEFAGLASRLDVQNFEAPREGKFELQREVEELVRPLLQTLKDATEEPRQVADLKAEIERLEQRQRTAESAVHAVERTRDRLPADSPARAEAQREIDQRWRPTLDGLRSDLLVLRARLLAKTQQQKSLLESISQSTQNFVQSSGTSLLLSVAVFLGVFLGLRFVTGRLLRRRRAERGFSLRLLEVALQAVTLLVAIAATLAVPYVRNDWLLLAVCIVFLIGIGWALVKTLPQFVEQIRLVLNIGGVREGERILVDGLPYRVDALRFYSRLHNPELDGGNLRVPLQFLIGKRSRRSAGDEPWFPCRTGDIVLLADGQFGKVRTQTPDVVVLEHYGTERTYPTAAFLEQTPRNLSRGFAIRSTLGIDYAHQQDAVVAIPAQLQQALREGLADAVAVDELKHVRVELAAAGSSSLDLQVIALFAGSAAPRYLQLERLVQALFVAACNQNGWRIPFPQLTLHRAAE
ncbi:MAG: hypothetical protein JNM25_12565 [Planctomycetes bacterium]|nr:hypothetical protein [Planctomycetota bacterium]